MGGTASISSLRPVLLTVDELVLREWQLDDVPVMVTLCDTAEMDRWTPLAHPFDETAAAAYVRQAHQGRPSGVLQLAITNSADRPLGEVLCDGLGLEPLSGDQLFPTELPDVCELAYAVGADHRGRALAARAVTAVLPLATAQGYRKARLRIAVDNHPSQQAARAAGFTLTDHPLLRRERKGYTLDMATWIRDLPGPSTIA